MSELDLPTRLAQALAFDYMRAVNSSLKWDALNRGGYELFKDGAEYENARLAPLHRALVDCVTALVETQTYLEGLSSGREIGTDMRTAGENAKRYAHQIIMEIRPALASLEAALSKESGK